MRGQWRHAEGWSVENEDMGIECRKQDWDTGMELGVAHMDVEAGNEISWRKNTGNKENVGRGTQAEGHPLKEMKRNGCYGYNQTPE